MTISLRRPRKFWLPKAGNSPEEYEDASRFVYPQRIGVSGRSLARIAVSDGASESAFAREWANILTDAFVARPPDLSCLTEDSLNDWLSLAQEEWDECIPWDRLPWHGEAKARAGAFATLLGMTIGSVSGSRRLFWQAVAVGDCCLFVVRDDRLWLSFPLDNADDFDNTPALVNSKATDAARLWNDVRRSSGKCHPGDTMILASDALACWFLAENAAERRPWEMLMTLDSPQWETWVDEQRREGLMRNDDTTLVMIDVV